MSGEFIVERLRSALPALGDEAADILERFQWRPIESAPRDGTRVLGYGKIGFSSVMSIGTVVFDARVGPGDGSWIGDPNEATEYQPEVCELTHWMPLPEAPK